MTTYYFDVTKTLEFDLHTGIQRVVRQIFRRCRDLLPTQGDEAIPVVAVDGRFHTLTPAGIETLLRDVPSRLRATRAAAAVPWYRRFIRRCLAADPRLWAPILERQTNARFRGQHRSLYADDPLDLRPGDVLVLLDHFFGGSPVIAAARRAARRGVRIVTLVYDMIPVTHSQFMTPLVRYTFRRGLLATARISVGLLTISDFCVGEIRRFLAPHVTPPPVRRFHLGHDLAGAEPDRPVGSSAFGDAAAAFWRSQGPTFLMIGSIEPRKGHALVLDGFDLAWSRGSEGKLLIIGRPGWDMEAFLARYATHPERGRRLLIASDMADADVAEAMRRGDAGIVASAVEGFGLPLVECLAAGLPVFAANIPVFREIANGSAAFFRRDDPATLAALIREFPQARPALQACADAFVWPDWNAAGAMFVAALRDLADPQKMVPS